MKRSIRICAALAVAVLTGIALPVLAHEEREVGGLETVVGWAEEPAYAGVPNAVSFEVSDADAEVELTVEVIFGDRKGTPRTEALPLEPVSGEGGRYEADIIPTRPGAYTFHVAGTLAGNKFDEFYTSGERTFDDVRATDDVQFPANDPSAEELTKRLEQTEQRLVAVRADAQKGDGLARFLAGAALLVALLSGMMAITRRRAA